MPLHATRFEHVLPEARRWQKKEEVHDAALYRHILQSKYTNSLTKDGKTAF